MFVSTAYLPPSSTDFVRVETTIYLYCQQRVLALVTPG